MGVEVRIDFLRRYSFRLRTEGCPRTWLDEEVEKGKGKLSKLGRGSMCKGPVVRGSLADSWNLVTLGDQVTGNVDRGVGGENKEERVIS